MNKEDKGLQKQLVDEMMKVSKTNPDVMIYMQALMKKYEELEKENNQHISDIQVLMNKKENLERLTKKLQKELDQYKNNWEELKKYVKEAFKDTITVSNGIIYKNKPIFEEISNKMKELEEE